MFSSKRTPNQLIAFSAAAILTISATMAHAQESRLKLWEIVHDQCIAGQQSEGSPAPCVEVNMAEGENRGYAIMPDRNGMAQFLLIPTQRLTGIESPAVLQPDLPDYWNAAWNARRYVFLKLHANLVPAAIGLAVNSYTSRSQDQLHIHIDCVAPEVYALLRQHMAEIGGQWSQLAFELAGQHYQARRILRPDLRGFNPFTSLTQELGVKEADMGKETIVIIGASFEDGQDGFVMLEDHADPMAGTKGHGEDLLDASCALATEG